MEIPKTIKRILCDEHGLDAEIIRCGLNPDQVGQLNADPIGLAGTPTQKAAFVQECGDQAYELDAVPPAELEQLVYDSIAAYTDMEVLEADMVAGNATREKFNDLQDYIKRAAEAKAQKLGLII